MRFLNVLKQCSRLYVKKPSTSTFSKCWKKLAIPVCYRKSGRPLCVEGYKLPGSVLWHWCRCNIPITTLTHSGRFSIWLYIYFNFKHTVAQKSHNTTTALLCKINTSLFLLCKYKHTVTECYTYSYIYFIVYHHSNNPQNCRNTTTTVSYLKMIKSRNNWYMGVFCILDEQMYLFFLKNNFVSDYRMHAMS